MLSSPNFPGIYARCTGSLPELGLFWSPAAYASADPITGLQKKGGIRSIAARTIELNEPDRRSLCLHKYLTKYFLFLAMAKAALCAISYASHAPCFPLLSPRLDLHAYAVAGSRQHVAYRDLGLRLC